MKEKAKTMFCSFLVALMFLVGSPLTAKELSATSDPTDLRAYIRRIAKLPRPTVDQLVLQANAYEWLKDYESGVKALDRAISISPKDGTLYAYRGFMLKHTGRLTQALDSLDKAESLGDESSGIFSDRMRIKLALSNYIGAQVDADKFLRFVPKSADAYYIKGIAADELGRSEESLSFLNKAIELNSTIAVYFQARGDVLTKLGRKREALSDFEKVKAFSEK